MSRYNSTPVIQPLNEKRRKSTTIFPALPLNTETDIYIRTTSVERLDKLAYKFYDDQTMWWIIAAANGFGKGTLIVPSNTRLRIPSKTSAMNILTETNRTR